MGRYPSCDALMESPDSALFEGIGSSVPRLELTNVHAKWVVVLIFQWFLLSSSFYGSAAYPYSCRNQCPPPPPPCLPNFVAVFVVSLLSLVIDPQVKTLDSNNGLE